MLLSPAADTPASERSAQLAKKGDILTGFLVMPSGRIPVGDIGSTAIARGTDYCSTE